MTSVQSYNCPMAGKSFLEKFPELALEASGWDPREVSHSSAKKRAWTCSLGHTYEAAVYSRAAGSGCPYCAGRKLLKGFNDLASQFPEVVSEADGWDPTETLKGTHAKKPWLCSLGHTYEMAVTKKVAGQNCPYCSGNKVWVGFNDLAHLRPDIAVQAYGWDPQTLTVRSGLTRQWKCSLGHVYQMRVAEKTDERKPQGCPYCSGKRVLAGFNDLAHKEPQVAAEAYGWNPTTLTSSSNKKVEWKCDRQHVWAASVNSRTNLNLRSGCPYCSGKKVLQGFNDLRTTHPLIADQAHGWDPTTLTAGSGRKVEWKCEYGHVWRTDPAHRTASQARGCPSCAVPGYDPNKPGWVYLLRDEARRLMQIGISNVPQQRLAKHRGSGWEIVDLQKFKGDEAYRIEQEVLAELRARGLGLPRKREGGFDGYTESWELRDLSVSNLDELLKIIFELNQRS